MFVTTELNEADEYVYIFAINQTVGQGCHIIFQKFGMPDLFQFQKS